MKNTMEYNGYTGIINYSNDDAVLYGNIFGINDLVTFEGETVTELQTSFKDAVNDYIDTCKQLNKMPDKPYKGNFNVRVPVLLHKEAALVALQKNITLNELVKTAIQNYIHV